MRFRAGPIGLARFGSTIVLALSVLLAPASSAVETIVPVTEPVATTSHPAVGTWKPAEKKMMRWINRARTKRDISAVKRRKTLGYLGRQHSKTMRAAGTIFHSDVADTVGLLSWQIAGENVGVGPTARGLHEAFMDSPGHRANVLSRAYDRVGVGLVRDSRGVIWVTVLFLG
jgi:uncharacterized protein YkwD